MCSSGSERIVAKPYGGLPATGRAYGTSLAARAALAPRYAAAVEQVRFSGPLLRRASGQLPLFAVDRELTGRLAPRYSRHRQRRHFAVVERDAFIGNATVKYATR